MENFYWIIAVIAVIIIVYINSSKSMKDRKTIKKAIENAVVEYPNVRFSKCDIKLDYTQNNVIVYAYFGAKKDIATDKEEYKRIQQDISNIVETTVNMEAKEINMILIKE